MLDPCCWRRHRHTPALSLHLMLVLTAENLTQQLHGMMVLIRTATILPPAPFQPHHFSLSLRTMIVTSVSLFLPSYQPGIAQNAGIMKTRAWAFDSFSQHVISFYAEHCEQCMLCQKLRIIVAHLLCLLPFMQAPWALLHGPQITHQLASCDADSLVGVLEHRNGLMSACTWLFHAMNPAVLCAVH